MYNRETELRHMKSNDVYKLGVILDDNNFWKKLMEIIPKELNAQECSANGALDWEEAITRGFKYNNDHIRLIENAIKRPGESRLFTEILFDEWSTSGRKSERPTLGVLLQLLVKADLFRAADFVAIEFLNEPPPERPSNGPGRRISISLPSEAFIDIKDVVNDTGFYPSTGTLNDNANYEHSVADNKDYYNKYHKKDKIIITHDNVPVAPPRTLRLARLSQLQQQRQQQEQQKLENTNEPTTAEASNNRICLSEQQQTSAESELPKFSQIMTSNDNISIIQSSNAIGIETNNTDYSQNTESTNLSEAPIPMISILNVSKKETEPETTNSQMKSNDVLPVISALNLNGERNGCDSDALSSFESQNESSLHLDASNILENIAENGESDIDDIEVNYEDDDDDDDSSVPNLSIFDQRSSNNDSSLTNVTGTSGENSFELSINECSSASNENIAGVQKS